MERSILTVAQGSTHPCRSFGCGFSMKQFALDYQGQPQLLVRLTFYTSSVLLLLSSVPAFGGGFTARPICFCAFRHCSASLALSDCPPTLPSADSCVALGSDLSSLSPYGQPYRPPGVRLDDLLRVDAGFIKHAPAGDGGLRGHVPARPERTTPRIRFLYLAPRFRIGLPSHPASRRRSCPSPCLWLPLHLARGLFRLGGSAWG